MDHRHPVLYPLFYELRAWPAVDYNLRRLGKKFIAQIAFLEWWQGERDKRVDIERCFGNLKRWYGLKASYVQGLENVMRHALLTCLAMLLTALAAQEIGHPDLSRSPRRLLADLWPGRKECVIGKKTVGQFTVQDSKNCPNGHAVMLNRSSYRFTHLLRYPQCPEHL